MLTIKQKNKLCDILDMMLTRAHPALKNKNLTDDNVRYISYINAHTEALKMHEYLTAKYGE